MAAVSTAVCWLAFVAVWLITANYNESRAPAQRQREGYGTVILPVVIIAILIRLVVPRSDWHSVTFYAPWARFLGLALLLAATALTLWARFVLGLMWSGVPAVKEGHQLRTEERLMTAEFPEEYPRYRRRVPRLVPGLRLLTGGRAAIGHGGEKVS
jgi:protein-S-isoprenylcysteine O-methyltransferase Ste14